MQGKSWKLGINGALNSYGSQKVTCKCGAGAIPGKSLGGSYASCLADPEPVAGAESKG